jgi:hypothetical protein
MRQTVQSRLLKHRFEAEVKALIERYAALADELYNEFYKPKTRAGMEALPKGWLPTDCEIGAVLGHSTVRLRFSGGNVDYDLRRKINMVLAAGTHRLFQARHKGGMCLSLEARHPISVKYERLQQDEQTLKEKFREVSKQTWAALSAVTTVAKLRSSWPEVSPFIDPRWDHHRPPLPALKTDVLNTMLGLPVDEEVD